MDDSNIIIKFSYMINFKIITFAIVLITLFFSVYEQVFIYVVGPLGHYFYNIFFLLSVLSFLTILVNRLRMFKIDKVFLFVLALITLALISSKGNNVSLYEGFRTFLFPMKFFIFYIIGKHIRTDLYLRKFEKTIIIILIGEILIGLCMFIFSSFNQSFVTFQLNGMRDVFISRMMEVGIMGSVTSKNIFGLLMAIGLIISFKRYLQSKLSIYVIICFIFILGVVISESKITILSILIYSLMKIFEGRRVQFSSLALSFLFILLFLLYAIDLEMPIPKVFSRDYFDVALEFGRVALFICSIDIILHNPFLGIGPGNWGTGLAFKAKEINAYSVEYGGFNIPIGVLQDNFWLSEASQFGLIYLVIFIILIVYVYHRSSKTIDIRLVVLIYVISSFVYPTFTMKSIGIFFWFYIGLKYPIPRFVEMKR